MGIVPLECGNKGRCVPLSEAEFHIASEASWGYLHISNTRDGSSKAYQYLTSNFGGTMPDVSESFQLVRASPVDACTPIDSIQNVTNKVVVADRGNCRFVAHCLTRVSLFMKTFDS